MHRLAALRSVGGYVRRAGSGVAALVRRAVMPCVGRYLYQMGRVVLGLVRRAVAFLEFEDGWDAAGYICLSLGLALMLLGTLAAPDLPALYVSADDPTAVASCDTQYCRINAPCRNRGDQCDLKNTGCFQNLDRCATCECVNDGVSGCDCYPAGGKVATE